MKRNIFSETLIIETQENKKVFEKNWKNSTSGSVGFEASRVERIKYILLVGFIGLSVLNGNLSTGLEFIMGRIIDKGIRRLK